MSTLESERDLEVFRQNVSSGPRDCPEFLLHTLRSIESSPLALPQLSEWPEGTEIVGHSLYSEGDPVVIEFCAIKAPRFPNDLQSALSTALLSFTQQGATLSWYVFEFTFDEDTTSLFGLWGAKSVYGFCTYEQMPLLALSNRERERESWKEPLSEALNYAYAQHPQLASYRPR